MRLLAVLACLFLLGFASESRAQFGPCGSGSGLCTCPDGVTVVTNVGQCPGAALNVPSLAIPRCGAGSLPGGVCVCSDGSLSAAGGSCGGRVCPAGQLRIGDNCRCVQRGFVINRATGLCGCPAGTVMAAGKSGPVCVKA